MFAMRVDFLLARATSAELNDRDRAEWPPHPSRLFSALVAAYHAGGAQSAERRALEWLEALAPPALRAPTAYRLRAQDCYVPVNDVVSLPERRKRMARSFPRAGLGDEASVWYCWAADASPHVSALSAMAARVPYLGHSSSLVAVFVTEGCPEPNLVPDAGGEVQLRVAGPGRLLALEEAYERGQRIGQRVQPPAERVQPYRVAGDAPRRAHTLPQGQFGVVLPFRIRGGRLLPLRQAVHLSEAVRNALMAEIATDIPAVLSGHDVDGGPLRAVHLAIVPFANVGHPHADGRVGGGALVLPPLDTRTRHVTERALSGTASVRLGGRGVFELRPVSPLVTHELPRYLRPRTYLSAADTWATVTPMVFQRHPRARAGRTVEEIVAEACTQAGLPAPVEVAASHVSHWAGAPAAHEVLRRVKTDRGRHIAHVRIRFSERIAGPVLIGAGRYFGQGFCRPVLGAALTASQEAA